MRKKGISLIVLVITIIIIIILASAIIITVSNNNPIGNANKAKYENDRDNLQALLTSTVSTITVDTQGTVMLIPGKINNISTGVKSAIGEIKYIVDEPMDKAQKEGKIVFDKSKKQKNGTIYYIPKDLPIYEAGNTNWYVDEQANISLKVGDEIFGDEEIVPSLEHSGKIPSGGKYYVGVASDKTGIYTDVSGNVITPLEVPNDFPIPEIGDVYVYGDYEYRYMFYNDGFNWYEDNFSGWGVDVLDNTKSSYSDILVSIVNIPILSLDSTFYGCTELVQSPVIPTSVTSMNGTFYKCSVLEESPIIPEGVINMYETFRNCSLLSKAPVIPESVKNMSSTFRDCSLLKFPIEINATPTSSSCCFYKTSITGVNDIKGKCSNKDKLLKCEL